MVAGNSDVWGRLMIAGQAGDRSAYRLLLDELRVWLIRYYRHRLPADLVDDAVQEALVAIHTKRQTWDPARPFGPWLAAIARYKWIDRLRHMAATRAEPLPDELPSALAVALVTADRGDAVVSATVLGRLLATLSRRRRRRSGWSSSMACRSRKRRRRADRMSR
ncbi:MAG: sigma factor [Janthinobacterium lividum]